MFFLGISVFLYLFSFFCWMDYVRSLGNLTVSFLFGCLVLVSLITIIYFIYRLFKKFSSGYFDKVFDLIVVSTNIVLVGSFILVLLLGIGREKIIPVARYQKFIKTFFGEVSRKNFYWFFVVLWCCLAPSMTVVYFVCKKTKIYWTLG